MFIDIDIHVHYYVLYIHTLLKPYIYNVLIVCKVYIVYIYTYTIYYVYYMNLSTGSREDFQREL